MGGPEKTDTIMNYVHQIEIHKVQKKSEAQSEAQIYRSKTFMIKLQFDWFEVWH